MNFLKRLFNRPEKITPSDLIAAGFTKRYNEVEDYTKDGFLLSFNPFTGAWVFDRLKKTGPGVIARFNAPLTRADLNYMLNYIREENEM